MNKPHLAATPPNEGARRLFWFLSNAVSAEGVDALRVMLDAMLDRLLSGEVVPGAELSDPIGEVTLGFVTHFDWQKPAEGGWFEAPVLRDARRAA